MTTANFMFVQKDCKKHDFLKVTCITTAHSNVAIIYQCKKCGQLLSENEYLITTGRVRSVGKLEHQTH